MRVRYSEVGDDLMVLKVPGFDLSDTDISDMMNVARKHKAMILDLRGDPGGSVETLKSLVACFFDKEIKIADRVDRDKSKPMLSKPNHHSLYTGKLVVLVDSKSASASELFARVIQIEKRATVMGDHTSGSVMESKHFSYSYGAQTLTFFGASITEADLIMADGKSLEQPGVMPDETLLPTASDLAQGRDPVLVRAAESLGTKLSPESAGKMFPFEWPSN